RRSGCVLRRGPRRRSERSRPRPSSSAGCSRTPTRRCRRRSPGPATSSSTTSRRRSRPRPSSRSRKPPWPRVSSSKMATETRPERLDPDVFDLPVEKMREGYYTDQYFNHTRAALLDDGRHPRVVMQVFQKKDAYLGGMDEAIAILKLCSDEWEGL